jgi:NADH:ubiquinone reductase (H+-translocating)
MNKRVVIVGAGFGGVSAAQSLAQLKNCDVHLIDRRNFHLFQPLLYQVAMAGLNPSDIAVPLRTIFRHQPNVHVILAEVDKIDCPQNRIHFDQRWIDYDYLILSCGAKHSYFGRNDWEEDAPGLTTVEQATEIRRRILTAFEMAEKEEDPIAREHLLTFVVIGGGPTGVELAGAISEMASHTLFRDYHNADLSKTKVILVEAGPRVLAAFPEDLSRVAQKNLEQLGVRVILNARASELTKDGVKVGDNFIYSKTKIWAAGVKPSSLTAQIPCEKDSQGRALVNADLSISGFSNVFVIGDQADFKSVDGKSLPGIAPVAIQQGMFLKKIIAADLKGAARPPFRYFDKGIMATIGRSKAVISTNGFKFSGFFAWLAWVFIHILYLMKFRNRFFVLLQWAWSYCTFGRGARLITYKTWKFYSGEKIPMD